MLHSNSSEYTLASVHDDQQYLDDANTPLLHPGSDAGVVYGATPGQSQHARPSSSKLLLTAAIRMAAVFVISSLVLGGTLWLAFPTLQEDDRPLLRIPKSFDDLQALNGLLKKYRDIYPYRIVICYVITYLFLQAFSLPGSMYLSILAGAVWGVPRALLLACTCVATGATLCYFISAAFGPALLTVPKWKSRLDKWSLKLLAQKDNIISFLIVLRIAPLPPHWVINVLCPHVGIGLVPFWISTWLGIFGVTVIHTSIGGGLDEMTSAADFHLVSWKNFFLLSAVVVGVLIPVGLRYYFKREIASVADVEQGGIEGGLVEEDEDEILAAGPIPRTKKAKASPRPSDLSEEETDAFFEEQDDDEDIILEAGPAIVIKPPEESIPSLDARTSVSR
ncbi:oxalate transporter [Phlebopus sp. FC_14]|nr:oxalate transporter [Phlebopus sp. FC_14]